MPKDTFYQYPYRAPTAPERDNPKGTPGRVAAPDNTNPQTPTDPKSKSDGRTKKAPADK